VGGTELDLRRDSSYGLESGWEDSLTGKGGGGGLSPTEPRPSWQRGPGVQNRFSNGNRQIPDVSAAGDFSTGWLIHTQGRLGHYGGTSAATPFWAASMLLVRQLAQREDAGRLGFVAPLLYRLGARRDSPYHDVTLGGNLHYRATKGWDFATGWGSPDVTKLAEQMVGELERAD
jgi:kumamolisin